MNEPLFICIEWVLMQRCDIEWKVEQMRMIGEINTRERERGAES